MTVNNIGNRFLPEKPKAAVTAKKSRTFEGSFLDGVESKDMTADEVKETVKKSGNMSVKSCYLTSAAAFYETGRVETRAVSECEVRNISYRESDYIKIAIEEGCTYKAQVEENTIYIEQKNEDGTVRGYEVDVRLVSPETKDPVEQAALEAWNKGNRSGEEAEEKENLWNFKEALQEYYDYVEERIKNGPPKIPTGGSEMSVEEWKKLIEKVDRDLEAVREEQAERFEKLQEEEQLEEPVEEARIKKLLEDKEESGETVSHVITKPDGSKVLEIQMKVGDKEVIKTLQIAPPAKIPGVDENTKVEEKWQL